VHSLDVYENATLTANRLDDELKAATGALYASDGKLITLSQRSVARTDAHLPSDADTLPRHSPVVGKYGIDGYDMYLDEAIFGGHIFAGWGHAITETISTAWAASEVDPDVPLVMVPWGRLWVSALPRIRETMRLAGWGDRKLVLASGSAVLGKVHVPERLIRFDDLIFGEASIPAKMNAVYDRMTDRSTGPSTDRVPTFLPRSRGHRRLHPHEVAVEEAMVERGFRVIEGWGMSVKEQIAVISSSSSLVGFSGSNLHNSVFANRGVPVVEVMDRRAHSKRYMERPLQAPLCDLRAQPFTRVEGFDEGTVRPLEDMLSQILDKSLAGHA
jgi:hypothetical protein